MATKKKQPKLSELIARSSPEEANKIINEAVDTIHNKPTSTSAQPVSPIKIEKSPVKMIRVSVDTPKDVHKELKKIVSEFEMDLRTFYLMAVREKCERLGYKLPSSLNDILK